MMWVERLLMSENNYLGEQRKKGPSPAQNYGIDRYYYFFEHKLKGLGLTFFQEPALLPIDTNYYTH